MAIKVIISRWVPAELADDVKPLMIKLRGLAKNQPGYISDETLINVDEHHDVVVVSTWNSLEEWQAWLANPVRTQIESEIEEMLRRPAQYKAYYCGELQKASPVASGEPAGTRA